MDEAYKNMMRLVEKEISGDAGHTMDHVMRVFRTAMQIASNYEDADIEVLKAAVLLHDVARIREDNDPTGKTDHAVLGEEIAERILRELSYPGQTIERIKHCIRTHRYRSAEEPDSIEARILYDADKIDLLGSVGIARSYMIAGEYNERLYSLTPLDEYVKSNSVDGKPDGRIMDICKHAPNIEFETKMRNIPERLFTKEAKEIADERMRFMEEFFLQLRGEISYDL